MSRRLSKKLRLKSKRSPTSDFSRHGKIALYPFRASLKTSSNLSRSRASSSTRSKTSSQILGLASLQPKQQKQSRRLFQASAKLRESLRLFAKSLSSLREALPTLKL